MIVFVDFEASSLGRNGFPIEIGWAAEDGSEEGHLIRPAPGWDEWAAEAEQVHHIPLERLRRDGEPHDEVARHLLEVLAGHALFASAPSWDGQWLSRLLRAAGLPRHALRLRDTEEAHRLAAIEELARVGVPEPARDALVEAVLVATRQAAEAAQPAHRALEDARRELRLWREVPRRAREAAARRPAP